MQFEIVEDSHYRRFLKLVGYGFVAQIVDIVGSPDKHTILRPMNKGCEMDKEVLWHAARDLMEAP